MARLGVLSQTSNKEWMERKMLPKRVQKSKHSVNTAGNRCSGITTGREKQGGWFKDAWCIRGTLPVELLILLFHETVLWGDDLYGRKRRRSVSCLLSAGFRDERPTAPQRLVKDSPPRRALYWSRGALRLWRPIKEQPPRCFTVGSPSRLLRGKITLQAPFFHVFAAGGERRLKERLY